MPILIFVLLTIFFQPLHAAEIQEFTADYEIYFGERRLGQASYRFSHNAGSSYRFDFTSKLRFFIVWDERNVSSEIDYEAPFLLPSYYSHDRKGTGRDYFEEIRFEPSEDRIQTSFKKKTKEFSYEKDIIDGLTVQLQMMLDLQRGIERPKYKILDVNKVREREFSFVSEELVNIQDVDLHSVVYQVVRDNNKRKTQMWFSTERNYLPVKLVHFTKGKKQFSAQLASYREFDSAVAAAD